MQKRYNKGKSKRDYGPRRNEYIRVPNVLLINAASENIGVIPTDEAMAMAKEAGLDLVEVGANASPPVCRIMDYSKYVYEQKKKQKANKVKGKQKALKEFRFTPAIDVGDVSFRVKRALQYLEKGHNVRITMYRKGRLTKEQAQETFDEILTKFEDYSTIEAEPQREGRKMFVTYKPNNGKTKK